MTRKKRSPFKDPRYLRVVGFLVSRGLLVSSSGEPRPTGKLDVLEALWVAEHAEPRVLEVLPAAVTRCKRSCINIEKLPEALRDIIKRLKDNNFDEKESYRGIFLRDMYQWLNVPLRDKRTKPVREHRKLKTFRLTPAAISALKARAEELGVSETAYIESMLVALHFPETSRR